MLDKTQLEKTQRLLQQFGINDPETQRKLAPCCHWVQFDKGDTVLAAGANSSEFWLIRQGLLRYYYITADGKERNKAFYTDGAFTGAVSAAVNQEPSPFTIEALEPSEMLALPVTVLFELMEHNTDILQHHTRRLAEAFVRNEQREAMLLTCNAEERYQWLLQREPEWVERISQFHLASYLGMDAVSLSRIKRKFG